MAEWDRQPGETPKAFLAFQRYLLMPPEQRSLRQLAAQTDGESMANPRHSRRRQLEIWSSRHRWQHRVQAWDEEQARLVRETEAEKWRQRVLEQRETDWAMAHLLREKARRILEDPNAFRKQKLQYYKGELISEQEELLTGAAIDAVDLSSKLARLAAEMETQIHKTELTGKEGGPVELRAQHTFEADFAARVLAILETSATAEPDPADAGDVPAPEGE